MVRFIFVAGTYAAAVLAAPAQGAAEVGAAPAGWGDNSPSWGESMFGWANPKSSKPVALTSEEASTSAGYAPPSSSSGWGSVFGGSKGGSGAGAGSSSAPPSSSDWGSRFNGNKGGSGADTSASPRPSLGGGGGLFSGLFGGLSRPKPSSSGSSSGSSWWRPKPDSESPKPEWPTTSEPKPASSESSEEAGSNASPPAPKPEPALPKPETAVPVPAPAQPEPKPEPALPKPETAAPVPVPAQPAPKPESESVSQSAEGSAGTCGPKPRQPDADGDIEIIRKRLWQPSVGSKWQIILDGVPDTARPALKPDDAHIWDIDLWDATAEDICNLKKQGKKVLCYFSAGTSETWRQDNDKLKPFNKGPVQMDDSPRGKVWEGESWIDIRETQVRNVMSDRIKMAAAKGCDGIDPDNMDGYDNVIKKTKTSAAFKLTDNDAAKYMKFLADEAARWGMSSGLKNSLGIISKVKNIVQFAVNEECAKIKECQEYNQLLGVKKPVFHIEYTGTSGTNRATTRTTYKDPNAATKKYCNPLKEVISRFSTIIKAGETLSNQYLYCDGKPADFTPMKSFTDKKGGGRGRGNFVASEEDADVDAEVNERFVNGTMIDEEVGGNSTVWRVKKRRHHRRAVLVDFV